MREHNHSVSLAAVFLRHVDGFDRSVARDALENILNDHYEAGRGAWPSVAIDAETYVRHLAERFTPPESDPQSALTALFGADLYLACACTHGDAKALRELDRCYIAPLTSYLRRSDALAGFGDDLKQMVRERLLVAGEGAARIALYNGQSPLKSWLRLMATRVAINFHRSLATADRASGQPNVPASEPAVTSDAEARYLKARYGDEFRSAFEKTLAKLSAREGNVLRLHFLEGMTSSHIAALYRVSRRTVHRWLIETRQRILDETHRRLRRRLNLSTTQLDTLVHLFHTHMLLGLSGLSSKRSGDE